jgi:eukaryotic-like serine/threonine-protein kinase
MTPERWAKVRELFDAAADLDSGPRGDFLDQACAGDADLLADVRALLKSLDDSGGFMSGPVSAAVAVHRQTAPTDALEGARIGPYKLLRRVGTGGMGSVYAAARVDQQYQKIVAIKIVKPGMDSEEILRRFRNERQVLASLEHPNIARLLDGGTTEQGVPYLVMEYVEGTPIDAYCDSHTLSVTERLALFRAVCSAVQYAHQNLVIHRDLKPGNILVNADGVPKLLDFGIAKLLRQDYAEQGPHLTRTNLRPMTPEYASPEQIRGEPITTASDVYSLGVLLYKLLTGQLPYRLKSQTALEIENAVVSSEPERPSAIVMSADKLRRSLRGDLDTILLMALRKEPQRRYPSVERFSDDIQRHLQRLPVSARNDTWHYRLTKFTARHKAGVMAALIVAVALMASTAVSIYQARKAQHEQELALQLVSFMLRDLDVALQTGVTSARKASVEKVLASIQQLSPNAAADPALRELLFDAYLTLGNIQGNPYGPNLDDPAGARRSYQRALELIRNSSRPGTVRKRARVERSLADLTATNGDRRAALELYVKTRDAFQSILAENPNDAQSIRDLMDADFKVGFTRNQIGDVSGALESYRARLSLAETLSALLPADADARHDVAAAEAKVGEMLARGNATGEALPHLRKAESLYENLVQSSPANARLQRERSIVAIDIANLFRASGDLAQAETLYLAAVSSLEKLAAADPRNVQYPRDVNSVLESLAQVFRDHGKLREARETTEKSLAMMAAVASKPGASGYDLEQYCWLLLTTRFSELHNPRAALVYSQKAVDLTNGSSPAALDMLARAHAENGDYGKAVEIERRVVGMIPAGGSSDRQEFEGQLTVFEKKLSGPPAAGPKQR